MNGPWNGQWGGQIGISLNVWTDSIYESLGGPFLLLVDGASHLRLVNNVDRLKITGTAPASSSTPTFFIYGF